MGDRGPKPESERDLKIVSMFKDGQSMQAIADKFLISRQRVSQITKRNGLCRHDGGAKKRSNKRRLKNKKYQDDWYLNRFGCDFDTYKSINSTKDDRGETPFSRYAMQRWNAQSRGIEWKFDFYSWWVIWQNSGKWDKRGRKYGQYVMGRKDDKGPYSPDNIEIITCSENISNGYAYMKKSG